MNQLVGSSGLLTLQAARHQDKYSLLPTGPGLAIRTEDFTCDGGTHDQPCTIPGGNNFVEGGLGGIGGKENHSNSHRDQIRADSAIYRGDHEFQLGADYQDGRTDLLNFFSGGQRVFRYNEFGDTYYLHRFFARSVDDLTPVDNPSSGVTRDAGAYVQDSWRLAPSLTLKAGLRFDREWIITYTGRPAFATSLWQPRLGVVWDPLGDGSSKVYASAGRFSYGLPTDLAIFAYGSRVFVQSYNFDPVATAPADVFGYTPSPPPSVNSGGEAVDRNLKGIASDELTLGVERSFEGGTLSLGIKATYRTLSQSIEDRCDLDYTMPENKGSSCALTNPGSSGQFSRGQFHYCTALDDFDNCAQDPPIPLYGAAALPEAKRIYRGIEILARKTVSQRLWVQASYIYSSLRGNYDGEVDEGYHGQTDPGISADFDYPQIIHNGYGRLYLDRPHQLRLDGYYQTPFGLSVGLQTWLRSGAPLNQLGYFNGLYGSAIQLVPKGYAGRLPMEWEANLTLEYPIRFGPAIVTLQGYVYNLFNNQIRLSQDTVFTAQQQDGYPDTIYDPNQRLEPKRNLRPGNRALGPATLPRRAPSIFLTSAIRHDDHDR